MSNPFTVKPLTPTQKTSGVITITVTQYFTNGGGYIAKTTSEDSFFCEVGDSPQEAKEKLMLRLKTLRASKRPISEEELCASCFEQACDCARDEAEAREQDTQEQAATGN